MIEMTFDLLSGMALRRATWTGDVRTIRRIERDVLAAWKGLATGLLDTGAFV
jgi:hypothetical protein